MIFWESFSAISDSDELKMAGVGSCLALATGNLWILMRAKRKCKNAPLEAFSQHLSTIFIIQQQN